MNFNLFKKKNENLEENVDVSQNETQEKKLERLKKDLLSILSKYNKLWEEKHKAYENYIKQLIDSWKEIDYNKAWELKESWEDKLLADNLEYCRWLKPPIAKYFIHHNLDAALENMAVLNYWVIEEWEKEPKITKIATFDFDESDYEDFISSCIHNWKWSRIACHINDFIVHEKTYDKNSSLYNVTCTLDWKPMFNVKYIEKIMWELIKFDWLGDNYYRTTFLDRFQKNYHWLINPGIAFKLIEMWSHGQIYDVAKNLSLFKPNKELVHKLVELWYWEKINAESISWFKWVEYKEIVEYMIDHWVRL